MSPPPTGLLFDPHLERLLVAAVILDPSHIETLPIAADELTDYHAKAGLSAAVNLFARGQRVSVESVRLELEVDGPRDLAWYDALIQLPGAAGDPPVAGWVSSILDLREARQQALLDAEPVPRKQPTGPRAKNTEPTRLAEAFRAYRYQVDGEPTMVRWARAWWRYDGTRYVEHDDEALDRDLIGFLDVAVAPVTVVDGKTGVARAELRRVTSKNKTISEVRKACLHAFPVLGSGAPQWTSAEPDDPDPVRLAPCANGVLNLSTRELLPRTPRLFSPTAIGTNWDPAAEAPTWRAFLTSLWEDDTNSIRALQQMFGYFLTPDTSQQKLFALIGLARSGKGTIARVLRALLGHDAVVNPTLDGLEDTFGLQPLVGKTLAIIGDARLGGANEQTRVVERLLSISGEDALLVNRKNTGMVNVRLRTRVLLLSNELPRLYDTSGALASRFVILNLRKSFLGREDTTLEAKLLAELPGIFRWAVDGYESLCEDGRFMVSAASQSSQDAMRALSSPMSVFLEECCVVERGQQVEIDTVWQRYKDWCAANGYERPGSKQWFGRNLNTVLPDISIVQPVRPDGRRPRIYQGLGLL